MKYGISGLTYSADNFIEMSQEEFAALTYARHGILTFSLIEEKFNLVIENYADYERELSEVALGRMLASGILRYGRARGTANLLTRRLVNLLSSARLYLDQVSHDLATVYGPSGAPAQRMEAARRQAYDERLEYRVMEKLRNHLQHRGLALWGMSYPSSWNEAGTQLQFRADPILDVEKLRADKHFSPAIVSELEEKGKQVRLTPLVRAYVEGLAVVHEEVRAATSADVAQWEELLAESQKRGRAWSKGGAVSLVEIDAAGVPVTSGHIFRDMWEYRQTLSQKNSGFQRLSSRYISTASNAEDDVWC